MKYDSPSERRAEKRARDHARRQAKKAQAEKQKELFKPVDVQRNLVTGAELLDPARPRTDLQAGTDNLDK